MSHSKNILADKMPNSSARSLVARNSTKKSDSSDGGDGGEVSGILQFRAALRLANYLRAWTFPQQNVEFADPLLYDPLNSHTSKLAAAVKYSYAAPQFTVLSLSMMLQVHGAIYYEYLGAPLAYIAFFTAFSRSFDVISDPLMSWLSDSTRTRWGRRIPYMVGGCWMYALSCILLLSPEWFFPTNSNAECSLAFDSEANATLFVPPFKDESEGLALSYWFGAMYVLFYLSDTVCNVPYNALGPELTDSYEERSSLYAVHGYFGVLGTIIGAVGPPVLEEVGVEKTLAFSIVGIFLVSYYVLSILNLAHNVGEREASSGPVVPLVPSFLRAFKNEAFSVLVKTWFIDATGWACLGAVLPFYVEYYVDPDRNNPEFGLSNDLTLGVALLALFGSALLSMPAWLYVSKRYGKFKTWIGYNVWQGFSNILYAFVVPGDIVTLMIVTVINGVPFGGQFLNNSILADCIDLDEFRTGERREAQFTMFQSFIPKLVAIPAQALPISIMASFGFIQSRPVCDQESGFTDVQFSEQNESVKWAIQIFFIAAPVLASFASIGLKLQYPLRTAEQSSMISAGIVLHARGLPALDPVSNELVPSLVSTFTTEEIHSALLLDHFSSKQKRHLATSNCNARPLILHFGVHIVLSLAAFGSAVFFVYKSFPLLDNQSLSWIPSLIQILTGLILMLVIFSYLRLKAAIRLHRKPLDVDFIVRWLDRSEGTSLLNSPDIDIDPADMINRLTSPDFDGGAAGVSVRNMNIRQGGGRRQSSGLSSIDSDDGSDGSDNNGNPILDAAAMRKKWQNQHHTGNNTNTGGRGRQGGGMTVGSSRNVMARNENHFERDVSHLISDANLLDGETEDDVFRKVGLIRRRFRQAGAMPGAVGGAVVGGVVGGLGAVGGGVVGGLGAVGEGVSSVGKHVFRTNLIGRVRGVSISEEKKEKKKKDSTRKNSTRRSDKRSSQPSSTLGPVTLGGPEDEEDEEEDTAKDSNV